MVIELLVCLLICCVPIELLCGYWTNKKENCAKIDILYYLHSLDTSKWGGNEAMPVNHQLTCDQAFLWKKNKLNSTKRRNWRRNKTGVGRWSADLFVCCFFLLLVITGAHRLLVIVRNSQRSIKELLTWIRGFLVTFLY